MQKKTNKKATRPAPRAISKPKPVKAMKVQPLSDSPTIADLEDKVRELIEVVNK